MKKKLDIAIELILFILIFSIFMGAKAIFNICLPILLIIGIIKKIKYKDFVKEKFFYWYFGAIIVGIVPNLLNGTVSKFLSDERRLWYIPLFILLNLNKNQYDKIGNSIFYGGILSGLYSTISYFTPKFLGIKTEYNNYQINNFRMSSFNNIIRWGSLLEVVTTFSFIKFLTDKTKIKKTLIIFSIFLLIWNLITNGTRASMVGIFISNVFLIINFIYNYKTKVLKYLIPIFLIIGIFLSYLTYANPSFKDRVCSISDKKNISNKIRLDYWKIGIDILKEKMLVGYGSKKTKEVFNNFIEKQSNEYKEKYFNNSIKIGSGTPFENNYLNLAIENGIVYVFYLNGIFIMIFIKILKSLKKLDNVNKIKGLIILSIILGNKVFVFFFPGTDSYVEFIITFLIFYAYEISNSEKLIKGEI